MPRLLSKVSPKHFFKDNRNVLAKTMKWRDAAMQAQVKGLGLQAEAAAAMKDPHARCKQAITLCRCHGNSPSRLIKNNSNKRTHTRGKCVSRNLKWIFHPP